MFTCNIYKLFPVLQDGTNGREYVGSTKQMLSERKYRHCRQAKSGKGIGLFDYMREVGIERFIIVPLESKEVKDDTEKRMLEQEWMERIGTTLNVRRAHTSPEKKLEIARLYKANHAEKIKADWKKYHAAHREELIQKKRAYRKRKQNTESCPV